jgi:hypothetical protein
MPAIVIHACITSAAALACCLSCVLQGYIVGCGLSGCATSTLSFLSQLRADSSASSHAPKDVAPAAFLYFAASSGITGSCVLAFFLLIRLKYSRVKLGPYLASKRDSYAQTMFATSSSTLGPGPAALALPHALPTIACSHCAVLRSWLRKRQSASVPALAQLQHAHTSIFWGLVNIAEQHALTAS